MQFVGYKKHERKTPKVFIFYKFNMSNSNKIFNVDEVAGKELVYPTHHRSFVLMLGFITRHSATAVEAQVEAPAAKIAREIEMNAKQEKTAAEQAAAAAAEVSRIFHIPPSAKAGGDKVALDLQKNLFY